MWVGVNVAQFGPVSGLPCHSRINSRVLCSGIECGARRLWRTGFEARRVARADHLGGLFPVSQEVIYKRIDVTQPSLNADAITSWKLYAFVFVVVVFIRGLQVALEG